MFLTRRHDDDHHLLNTNNNYGNNADMEGFAASDKD